MIEEENIIKEAQALLNEERAGRKKKVQAILTEERGTRNTEKSIKPSVNWVNKQWAVNPLYKREGYELAWKRVNLNGQNDMNLKEALEQGYTAVPRNRVHGVTADDDPFNNQPEQYKRFVMYKDQLLFEIPTEIFLEMENKAITHNNAQMKSLRQIAT